MTNINLIEEAVRLVVDLFEAEGIAETTTSIRERASKWYNNTEITDAEMLAAATITGSYQFGTSWDELVDWKNFYFPSPIAKVNRIPHTTEEELLMMQMENFHIGEIEDAQRDMLWM